MQTVGSAFDALRAPLAHAVRRFEWAALVRKVRENRMRDASVIPVDRAARAEFP